MTSYPCPFDKAHEPSRTYAALQVHIGRYHPQAIIEAGNATAYFEGLVRMYDHR